MNGNELKTKTKFGLRHPDMVQVSFWVRRRDYQQYKDICSLDLISFSDLVRGVLRRYVPERKKLLEERAKLSGTD